MARTKRFCECGNKITSRIKDRAICAACFAKSIGKKPKEITCKCGIKFTILVTDHRYNKGEYKKHCSIKCSNSHTVSSELRQKISASVKKYVETLTDRRPTIKCLMCDTMFIKKDKHHRFCSPKCYREEYRIRMGDPKLRRQYRRDCAFKFNIYDYPELFDLSLIDKHGLFDVRSMDKYNPKGISLDHKVSCRDGFDNKYDPYYMSHLMNCQLLTHAENKKKGSNSSIEYSELVRLVDEFDSK